MNYKVGVIKIKRVAFLLMTMALAVAMVACEGAVGKPGDSAGPALQPPYVALALPALPALVQGMSGTVDLSTAFADPDGETLTLSAKSTDPAIATAKVSGKTLTVTGVKVGTTSVVVTATDADDLKVSQSVQVTVTAAPPEPDPPVTIDDVKTKYPTLVITPTTAADVSMEIELPAEHTLESENQSVVTVARKMAAAPASSIRWAAATADTTANVWVVTAVAKGLTNVDVLDKSGASVHTIRVRVATNPPAPEPDPVAPTKAADIPDRKLYKDDGAATIDLSDHFTHEMDIMYEASSDPTGFVSTKVAEGILTLTPRVTGQTIVTVTATADGMSAPDEFTVTVMAGSTPTPTPTPSDPPTNVGAIMAKAVKVGASLAAMDVTGYFSPTGLNYTAVSSDASKATAAIPPDSSSLTIAGVAIGTVTVTVTATDSDGRIAKQPISVTVTGPGESLKTIPGVTKTVDVESGEDQILDDAADSEFVTAARKDGSTTMWTLTGIKKTPDNDPAEVRVKENNRIVGKILVTVENTKPTSKDARPTNIIVASTGAIAAVTSHMYVDDKGEVTDGSTDTADMNATDQRRLYHFYRFTFSDYFEDADDTADLKDYKAESLDKTYFKVVKAMKDGVVVDVKKEVGADFKLEIYVVDRADEMSDRIQVTAKVATPLADKYVVQQKLPTGSFAPANVYQREGVTHTLEFDGYKPDGDDSDSDSDDAVFGFRFVEKFVEETIPAKDKVHDPGTTTLVAPASPFDDTAGSYYSLKKTGPIMLVSDPKNEGPATDEGLTLPKGSPPDAVIPTLMFKVTGGGESTVEITYNSQICDPDQNDLLKCAKSGNRMLDSTKETLTMNIVPSS